MSRALAASVVFATLCLCLAPTLARGEGVSSRVFGIGWGLAVGSESTSVNTDHTIVQLANLEVRLPLTKRIELAAHVPVLNVLYGNGVFGNQGNDQRFVWFDVFAVWYPLRDSSGLFVAPGLGLIWGRTAQSSGVAIELPARLGWEFSRASRGFGRAVSVRPWFDLVFPSGNVDNGTRYGVLFELTLIGYGTRNSS